MCIIRRLSGKILIRPVGTLMTARRGGEWAGEVERGMHTGTQRQSGHGESLLFGIGRRDSSILCTRVSAVTGTVANGTSYAMVRTTI